MYIGNNEGKIKLTKFVKKVVGKKAGKLLKSVVKTAIPFVLPPAAEAAIKAFEKKKGRKATPEEIEQVTGISQIEPTPQIFGMNWYIPAGIATIAGVGLLFLKKRR